ncbi:glycosyltransferase [Nodularia spumigena CS-584]|uniref:Glycosyltransferase n=1 Tax=Nodularia spumigena UHCC 0060 TaxID=3110300 RepID=A0ABU5UP98_NODSP|nr:glycosyltransferase [Nodularia spumigena]AHJ30105.1 putative glycosyltransferase [Nodularia spumigena CCY9414]MDB9384396.1 glycosyltransferase [Nodularia spumigena CS-584]MEA5523427.1 glycosyltransferase [Nodularia spumigena UHCC 0143]MEA5607395.1 glycosyltransferase [Nodularia spumigena UHCC 0060]MEA5614320.1 glycosyltransferase [Nodularia spumigena UHCC 0040]
MFQFSCLMSVYAKEKPEYLFQSLQSIKDQTVSATELVLVEDGPLTPDLYRVLEQFSELNLKRIKLPQNLGLGLALKEGVINCSHELIIRMDSDDVSNSTRFENQVKFLQSRPEIDVVGSWILEFDNDLKSIFSKRVLPTNPDEIKHFARLRNPLNHMTVAFRKSAVISASNYQSFLYFEDYYLWVRMIMNGSQLANIPEYLVKARTGSGMLFRRNGYKYAIQELKLQREFLQLGFINKRIFIKNILLRVPPRLIPVFLLKIVYSTLRSSSYLKYKKNIGIN